jgi:hypothetical protein
MFEGTTGSKSWPNSALVGTAKTSLMPRLYHYDDEGDRLSFFSGHSTG